MMLFISLFGFIGITALIFVWGSSSREFGAPPLFFRVFASFIALGFIFVGFGLPLGAIRARRALDAQSPDAMSPTPDLSGSTEETASTPGAGYQCPHCGSRLGKEADVSPSGDVKCTYCAKWWNIHQS